MKFLPSGHEARLVQLRLHKYTNKYTEGVLFFDDVKVLDTLEDPERDFNNDGDLEDEGEAKVYGDTAILRQFYKLTVSYSEHFKKLMVLVNDVPYFKGVRYHGGLNKSHTKGCVLVGVRAGDGRLHQNNGTDKMIAIVRQCIKEDGYCYVKIR